MSRREIETILEQVEQLLATAGTLPAEVEEAVEKLLNVVESLSSHNQSLLEEVKRLRQEKKKKAKTTSQQNQGDDKKSKDDSNHSSEKRRKRAKKDRPAHDRRTFKDLTIHDTIECPVDPSTLPSDAVRMPDESKVVQDVVVKPNNILFQRHVYYSAKQNKYFRGPLPSGYDLGDFGGALRALILSLKYCGNMSEPKIREFLENFDVQISAGSMSNILTKTADSFSHEFDNIVHAGLSSTPYQQTDDTSARVAGKFWHTHILCNPFYAAYFTRPQKDRLTVLEILQNTNELRFRFGKETLSLLQAEFDIPKKWQQALEGIGEVECGKTALALILQGWFGNGNRQVRTAIEQASIVYYRHQESVPVVETILCDDAGQFKLLTEKLALDDRIAKTEAKKDELLTVLSVPSVPLHNNGSELQARVSARRRDVSLHSRSIRGARAMDIFTTLVQTAKLHGISAYAYFRDRISRRFELPSLATVIRNAGLASVNETAIGHAV